MSVTDTELRIFDFFWLVPVTTTRFRFASVSALDFAGWELLLWA